MIITVTLLTVIPCQGESWQAEIGYVTDIELGDIVDLPITISETDRSLGAFALIIAYDSTRLILQDVTPGSHINNCWETFFWQTGSKIGTAPGQQYELLQILAIADDINDPATPDNSCLYGPGEIASLRFQVMDDSMNTDGYAPVCFFWRTSHCGDNTFSDTTGNQSMLSEYVYDHTGTETTADQAGFGGSQLFCTTLDTLAQYPPLRMVDFYSGGIFIGDPTSVHDDNPAQLPESFELGQNYPNPFNQSTTIHFYLPRPGSWKLEIFNILGQVVQTFTGSGAGKTIVAWEATAQVSGVYLYRLSCGNFSKTKKMVLLK